MRRSVGPLVSLAVVALVLSAGAAAMQDDDVHIKRKGETEFVPWTDDVLGRGDIVKTGSTDLVWTLSDDTEWWLGEDSELFYESSRVIELLSGEMEAVDERPRAKDRFTLLVDAFDVILDRGGVAVVFDEQEVQVDAIEDFEKVDIKIDAVTTGFRVKLGDGQMVSLSFDPDTEATQVIVPAGSAGKIVIELADNPIRIVAGDLTLQELYQGANRISLPPGAEIEIGLAKSAFQPGGAAPAPAVATTITPGDLEIPVDQPYEDSGDVALLVNVSPSRPE